MRLNVETRANKELLRAKVAEITNLITLKLNYLKLKTVF